MKSMKSGSRIVTIVAGSVFAVLLGTAAFVATGAIDPLSSAAFAQTGGSGQAGKPDDKGNQGQGEGQGGPSADSEGKGPKAGSAGSNAGGKPVWAQEGIEEVELGRLNVVRSPDQVLDRALAEAVKLLTPEAVAYYNLSVTDAIYQLTNDWDGTTMVDSPLQNLALVRDILDGGTAMSDAGVTNTSGTLIAMLIAAASDKNIAISTQTVVAVTTILGTPLTGDSAASIAKAAEAIRVAIAIAHG
ncbi:MAG: hypothetical protein ACK4MS_07075 [Paracoccaceae bacterium]